MEEVGSLTEELSGVLDGMQQTEITLAQLHAGIYKCREEARKVRKSAPTQEYVDGVRARLAAGMTETEATRCAGVLRDKLKKARAAAKKMRERLTCQFRLQQPHRGRGTWLIVVALLVVAAAGAVGGYYYYLRHKRAVPLSDSISSSTKSE